METCCRWETEKNDGVVWTVGCSGDDRYTYGVNIDYINGGSKYFHFLYCPFCGKKIEQIEVEK